MTTGSSNDRAGLATLDDLPASALRKSWGRAARILNSLGPLLGLLTVTAFFWAERPDTFFIRDNFEVILKSVVVVATAALGATVVIISGGIDLSVGSSIALCTVVIAEALVAGHSPVVSIACGIGASVCVGLVIGLLVTTLRLSPFIATLGLWGAVRGLAKLFAGETNVNLPRNIKTTPMFHLLTALRDDQRWMIFPAGVWIMFALTVVVGLVLRYTRFGRHVFAIGSNEQTARLCGVRVETGKVMIYLFAGLFAGIAGVMEISQLKAGDPTTADGTELSVIAAVVIGGASLTGGQGGVAGTIVGATLMAVVQNGCTAMGWKTSIQQIVTGGIIVLAAVLDRFRHRQIT